MLRAALSEVEGTYPDLDILVQATEPTPNTTTRDLSPQEGPSGGVKTNTNSSPHVGRLTSTDLPTTHMIRLPSCRSSRQLLQVQEGEAKDPPNFSETVRKLHQVDPSQIPANHLYSRGAREVSAPLALDLRLDNRKRDTNLPRHGVHINPALSSTIVQDGPGSEASGSFESGCRLLLACKAAELPEAFGFRHRGCAGARHPRPMAKTLKQRVGLGKPRDAGAALLQ